MSDLFYVGLVIALCIGGGFGVGMVLYWWYSRAPKAPYPPVWSELPQDGWREFADGDVHLYRVNGKDVAAIYRATGSAGPWVVFDLRAGKYWEVPITCTNMEEIRAWTLAVWRMG